MEDPFSLRIFYGTEDRSVDVTSLVLQKCVHEKYDNENNKKEKIIHIPSNDFVRAALFTDVAPNFHKYILIVKDDFDKSSPDYVSLIQNRLEDAVLICDRSVLPSTMTLVIGAEDDIFIDMNTNEIFATEHFSSNRFRKIPDRIILMFPQFHAQKILGELHDTLRLQGGSFKEELPEQLMSVMYIKGHENVLEIGGNIGRNSMVIASILNKNFNKNLVVLESSESIASTLENNRDRNGLKFQIESSALSKRKLIQKGWETISSEELLPGFTPVKTITWEELKEKYGINFDTLVLDCEGAFYYILMDMPEILENIKLIIMENDYWDISHKQYIDEVLKKNNFSVEYSEAGGWGPCFNNFFEVWKKVE